ncbi:MAG: hypothetical protein ACTSRP_23785 [Candidatus Helarchaeota archaeon]
MIFNVEPLYIRNLSMACIKCGYKSPIYLSNCPECGFSLKPQIYLKYLKFKDFIDKINVKNAVKPEYFKNYLEENGFLESDLLDEIELNFILINYSIFIAEKFYGALLEYYYNFKEILGANFLYNLRKEIVIELKFISKLLKFFSGIKEKPTIKLNKLQRFNILNYIRDILSKIALSNMNIKNSKDNENWEKLDDIIFIFLNQMILKLSNNLFDKKDNFELIFAFQEFIGNFSKSKNDFIKVPKNFVNLLKYEPYIKILNRYKIEIVYLPENNVLVFIKEDYAPDLDIIENLTEKKGGLTLVDLGKAFKGGILEAELAVQYLYKRKLTVKTRCYLRGTRYFLLK